MSFWCDQFSPEPLQVMTKFELRALTVQLLRHVLNVPVSTGVNYYPVSKKSQVGLVSSRHLR